MAILRQFNFLGQERIDVPHQRSIESAVAADFDLLMGQMICGKKSFILDGFKVVVTGAVGAKATALQVIVAGAKVAHYNASESGTIYFAPADQAVEVLSAINPKVTGSFTASSVNYLGVDLRRSADDTTTDTAAFLDADNLDQEIFRTVPLGRTLDYLFVVSTIGFDTTPTVAPIAKITTDASNNVTVIEDARSLLFRLGTGGVTPDSLNAYAWPEGRLENTTGDVFYGGDKPIGDLKAWMDAVMTRLWEVGGGERWYSSVSDRNVKMARTGAAFTNGEYFEWDATHLHWKGIRFTFPNSTGYYNDVANQTTDSTGLTDLADGDCIYVDLDFTANRTAGTAIVAAKSTTTLLGSPTTPGARHIIAWRIGSYIFVRDGAWPVGSHFDPATTTSLGVVKLSKTPTDAAAPIVLTNTERDATSGVAGLDASQAVLGTGIYRGTTQSTGRITIGGTSNDRNVLLKGNSSIGADLASVRLDDQSDWSTGVGGYTLNIQSGTTDRVKISNRGNIDLIRHITQTSAAIKEDSLTFTNGFEDVTHHGAGAGTVTPSGVTGGTTRECHVLITLTGGLGAGEFKLSLNSGATYSSATVIPMGGVYTDTTGLILTFSNNTFTATDVFTFRPRFVPQMINMDSIGNIHGVIDHNGFRLGRVSKIDESWLVDWSAVTTIPTPSIWKMSASGSGAINSVNNNNTFRAPHVTLNDANADSGDKITLYTTSAFMSTASGSPCLAVAEWEAKVDTTTQTVQMGFRLAAGAAPATTTNGMWFEKSAGGAWDVKVKDGSTTTVTTSYTSEGESTVARFRIELVGPALADALGLGTNAFARFWINEDLVAELNSGTDHVPLATFGFAFLVSATANATVIDSRFSPIKIVWTRLLTSPAL